MCKINVHSIYQHPDWIDKETRAPSILRESKSSTALGQPWPLNITFSSTLCGIQHRYGGSGCRWHYFVIIFVLVISHHDVSKKGKKKAVCFRDICCFFSIDKIFLPYIIVKSEAAHSFTSAKVGKTLSVVQIPSLSIVQFVLSDGSDVFTGQFAVSIWNAHEPKVIFKNLIGYIFLIKWWMQRETFLRRSLLRNSNQIVTFGLWRRYAIMSNWKGKVWIFDTFLIER